jgi:hypothetical protein
VVGKGREFLVRMNPWLTLWRPHRRRWDSPRESRRRGVKAEPRGGRRRRLDGGENLYPRAVSKGRGIAASRSGFQVTGGEDPLTSCYYPSAQTQIPTSVTRITAGSRRRRDVSDAGVLIWSRYCTMESCIQIAWQTNLEPIFLSIPNDNSCQALQQNWRAMYHIQYCNMVMPQKTIGPCLNLGLKLMSVHCQFDFRL